MYSRSHMADDPAALTVFMFTPLIPVFLILLMQVASLHEFSRSFKMKVYVRHS